MLRRLSTKVTNSNGFRVSSLPNGVKVASANTIPGGPFCSAGVLIKTAGVNAQREPNDIGTASAYIMEKLAFKETSTIKSVEMQRRLDSLVGSAMSKANREFLLISSAIVPDQTKEALGLIKEIIQDTAISKSDLEEMKAVVSYDLEELSNRPEELIPEMVHGPAFYGGRHGNSILSISETLERISVEDVYNFRKSIMRRGDVYAVGAGIPHDQLQEISYEVFADDHALAEKSSKDSSPMQYQGGERYVEASDLPLIHIGIGFKGIPAGHPDAYAQAVLQMLLGGGGSFSAGGPGKGMYSRLYTQVLNRHHWIESAKVFSHAYNQVGLFGIHGSALPSHARELTLVILEQMASLVRNPVSSVEFGRAKAQVRSAVLMGLESRLTQLEDLADQLSHRSEASLESPAEICKMIEAVQPEDLTRVAKSILSGNRPSVVAYGPLSRVPPYMTISDWTSRLF